MSKPSQDPIALRIEIEGLMAAKVWTQAAPALVDLAGIVDEPSERYEALIQAADVYESRLDNIEASVTIRLAAAEVLADDMGLLEDAIAVYRVVLSLDETNAEALEALEALYGETEDWNELLALFERRAENATDQERVELFRKQAIILTEVLDDGVSASRAWHEVLQHQPHDHEAAAALERLYHSAGNWSELADFYLVQAGRISGHEKVDYLIRAAQVQQEQLEAKDSAIATWSRVVEIEPDNSRALEALERLFEGAGKLEQLIQTLEQQIAGESDEERRLQLLVRVGDLHWKEEQDRTKATGAYERALEVQREYLPALDALVDMFRELQDWAMAAGTLELKLRAVSSASAQADVHLELAEVTIQKTGSADYAIGHLELAVELAPQNVHALVALGDYYLSCEQWAKALPLFKAATPLLHRIRDRELLARLHANAGRCSDNLLDPDGAIEGYQASVRLLKPSLELLWRLGVLCHEEEMYQEAQTYLSRLESQYEEELSEQQRRELTVMLSECAKELGKLTLAVSLASAAEMLAPQDAEGMRRLIPILEARGKLDQIIEFKERLYAMADSNEDRSRIAIELAESYIKHRDDRQSAMDWYRNALSSAPDNKVAAVALLEFHIGRREFKEAVRLLAHLAKREQTREKRSRWLMSIAAIYAEEFKDMRKARDFYERVLDADPSNLEAFQGLDSMLAEAGQWKELERSYRRMIQRVTKHSDKSSDDKRSRKLLFMLYRNLGEIYRKHMERPEYAISSYELALTFSPADANTRLTLAKLCVRTPQHVDKAIENYRFLVRAYPDQVESYHKLSALYTTTGQTDRAWAIAGLLRILGESHSAEDRMYEKLSPRQLAKPRRPLDDTIWTRCIIPQREDPAMGKLFHFLYALLGPTLIFKQPKALGLGKGNRLDPEEKNTFTSVLSHCAAVLGMSPPEVYVSNDSPGLNLIPTHPTALLVGTKVVASSKVQGLGFHVAKHLVYCTPWRIMAGICTSDTLHAFFVAAATLVNPKFKVMMPTDQEPAKRQELLQQIATIRAQLDSTLTSESGRQLVALVQAVNNAGKPSVTTDWQRSVELTANRVALLVANDVELAGRIIKSQGAAMSSLSSSEKLRDLFTYVLGDRYASARRLSGLSITR